MKNYLMLFMCAVLLMTGGCGRVSGAPAAAEPAQTVVLAAQKTAEQSTEETAATQLADKTATVLPLEAPAIKGTLSKGDKVTILEENDCYYAVETAKGNGFVEKCVVKPEGEAEFKSWKGYAYYNAKLYPTYHVFGEEYEVLQRNTKVNVVEEVGTCYEVELDGKIGFMKKDEVLKNAYYPQSSGKDGQDIDLAAKNSGWTIRPLAGSTEKARKGTIRVDGAELIQSFLKRGESVQVKSVENGMAKVLIDGVTYDMHTAEFRNQNEKEYESWRGYPKGDSELYPDLYLTGESLRKLKTNEKTTVLESFGEVLLIELADGTQGYIDADCIYTYALKSYLTERQWTEPIM